MTLNWKLYRKRIEAVRSHAQELFPSDEFYIETTIWETGNFYIEAVHGHQDTPLEEAVIGDEDGNIVYVERKRVVDSQAKEILSGDVLESDDDLTFEEWRKRRMR